MRYRKWWHLRYDNVHNPGIYSTVRQGGREQVGQGPGRLYSLPPVSISFLLPGRGACTQPTQRVRRSQLHRVLKSKGRFAVNYMMVLSPYLSAGFYINEVKALSLPPEAKPG